jgi:surface protein
MSFGYATKRNIAPKQVSTSNPSTVVTPWIRNPAWTALPAMTGADNKFVGLHRVDTDSNFLALSAAGNYTVDWGDGSATENINSGVVAQHQYVFTDAGLANTNAPVTLTDTGDLVTRTAHGYLNGYTVSFYNIVSTTGLSEGQIYYVISATANTFQVSATLGGSAVALTTDGTATLLPYKLAVVTVTPQAGQTFTTINVHKKHSQSGLNAYSSGFLDIKIAGSSLTSILLGVSTAGGSTRLIDFRSLEQVCILSNAMTGTSASYLFSTMTELQNVDLVFDSALTDTSFMFTFCTSLKIVPLFNTASVTTMASMFSGCTSLTSVPLFNTVSATSMNQMFNSCASLTTVPLFNTANVTDMTSMFNGCSSLPSVPLFNTVKVTSFTSMFQSCLSLTTVPLFNVAAVTAINMSAMFSTCQSLTTVPLFNTANVNNMSSMFSGCPSLKTVPLFNTASVTNMSSMFTNCTSLTSVPLFNTASVTTMASMFSGCTSLTSVPLFNTIGTALTMSSMFGNCTSLTSVPLFNTASVTIMSAMFNGCSALVSIPLFNTANVTNISSAFAACTSLTELPLLNFANVTNTTSIFFANPSLSKAAFSGNRTALSYSTCKLSETALTSIIDNLGTAITQGNTINISSNWGAVTPVSLTCTPTAGSTTITAASTTGVTVGMQWTGVGSPATTAIACTFTDTGDLVTKTAHGLSNGDEVSFATIVTTTGIVINKIYFVISAATDTFQVAATSGGAAVALTTNGTGTVRWRSVVTAVTTNTSITVSRPATATGSTSLAFRTLKTQTALLKGFAVSG